MNIYTILMAKPSNQSLFPKLNLTDKQLKSKDNKQHKKASFQKREVQSIRLQKRFRLTYQQALQLPQFAIKETSQNSISSREKKIHSTFTQKHQQQNRYQMSQFIPQFKKIKSIGKGGFAQVFAALDQNGQEIAVKQYDLNQINGCYKNQTYVGEHFWVQGKLKDIFLDEKGLIKFIGKCKNGKKGYIMQQIGGLSLSKMTSQIVGIFYKNERIYEVRFTQFYHQLATSKKLGCLLMQVSQTIQLLNSQGFIHCDLKPDNILVSEINQSLTCKVIDYGSTFKIGSGLPKITITPEYMPPEFLQALDSNNQQIDLSKIDVWSIGCILLEIVSGIPLWFRYKCKIKIRGKQTVSLGFFAMSNREYHKIIKKQREICHSIKKIEFVTPEFQPFRKLLMRILVFEQTDRANISQVIELLEQLQ